MEYSKGESNEDGEIKDGDRYDKETKDSDKDKKEDKKELNPKLAWYWLSRTFLLC